MNDNMQQHYIQQSINDAPTEAIEVTTKLAKPQSSGRTSRRGLLKWTLAGTAGLAAVGAGGWAVENILHAQATHAEATSGGSTIKDYFSILATGEALFATFYSLGVLNHKVLKITGTQLATLKAMQAEEELHLSFAKSQGGVMATTHFSFPHGATTFQDRALFLETQQLAEELTNGALLAWIKDMATMGKPRLAQIGGELMQVEGGHRVAGRVMMKSSPYENWAFGPVAALDNFTQVPDAVKNAGFLSPKPGNDFMYQPTNPTLTGIVNKNA